MAEERDKNLMGKVPPNLKARPRPRKMRKLERKVAADEFMAAAIGDLDWLKQSLKERKGELTYDDNGLSPVHLASLHGRLDCLKLLVEKHKVDVNLPSTTGWRPIHLSISNQTGNRSLQCLLYLLQHGADASVTNEDGVTPVHQAASEGHVQCLKLLIDVKAKIDAKDRRGHLPIDLAKLWGHRKCARILATEKWHQDKDFISQEMRELKKTKMQEALRELEDYENRDDEQFYGHTAFNDWLNQHGVQTKESKKKPKPPRGKKKEAQPGPRKQEVKRGPGDAGPVSGGKQEPIKESLHKPNSISTGNPGQKVEMPSQERKVQIVTRKGSDDDEGWSKTPVSVAHLSPERRLYGDLGAKPQKPEPTRPEPDIPQILIPWNKSTKVKDTFNEYLPKLPDVYPRDNYTMLPLKHATPHELNIWKSPKIFVTNESEQIRRADEETNIKKKLDDMKISEETKEVILNPNSVDRAVLYRCKNIIDVPSKKKVSENEKPLNEGALHLTSDYSSNLAKRALVIDLEKELNPIPLTRFRPGGSGDTLPPRERLLKAFETFTKPVIYPHIYGEQYDLNLGDFSGL